MYCNDISCRKLYIVHTPRVVLAVNPLLDDVYIVHTPCVLLSVNPLLDDVYLSDFHLREHTSSANLHCFIT